MSENIYASYVEELEKLAVKQGWDLVKHYRSSWCSFTRPHKRLVAFGIMLGAQNDSYLYIKRVHVEAESFPIKAHKHSAQWDQDEFLLEPVVTQLETYLPLLKLAYSRC